ncbi:MAG: hypothetical protein NUV69_05595 [Candidatus Curtissbacteria bacterium]|nr:hypothetical protein [Candidatus Curtissbacteria bacterium]
MDQEQQTPQKRPFHIPAVLMSLLIFLTGPLAYFLMIREKKYHRWLSVLLILFGLSYGLIFAFQSLVVGPNIDTVLQNVGAKPQTPIVSDYFLLAFNVLELIFGVYLFIQTKSQNGPSKTLLLIAATLLSANAIIVAIETYNSVDSTLIPYYKTASELNY